MKDPDNLYDKTHRCTKSVNGKHPIRHYTDIKGFYGILSGWYLFQYKVDYEYDWKGIFRVAKINYCPFCGEKLA